MYSKSNASIFTILIVGLLFSHSAEGQEEKMLEWPEITQQSKPWTRWWWMGSAVDKKNISTLLEQYQQAGIGGVEITPIYGVKGYEEKFIDFLSPQWMEMLSHTLEESERLGMGVDMAQASGWPFGGPWVSREDASKYVTQKTWSLKSGESLKTPVRLIQEPLVRTVGKEIAISDLEEPIAENPNLQLHAFDQVRFPKPLPLQALMAYSEDGRTLELTDKVNSEGFLDWTAPEGEWQLYAVFQGWHGKMVERAGPGGEGNVIDHFSEEATENYLDRFDEAFEDFNVSPIRAFFNDSYEVDDAFGEANWTSEMFEEFHDRRGYDLRDHLPALFGEGTEEQNRRVLTDYRETISDLILENYSEEWNEWAAEHDALIRNQAHGSPANILDLYAVADIPEIEGRDIEDIKFASSAAHITGKKLTSSESATWLDEHFLSSLSDVKGAMDVFLLGGVNHTFYHGTNYSPTEEAWPGWLFYAAVHFNPNNTFWDHFGKLNTYVARVQSFLQEGKADNDILLYLPIYDAFSEPGDALLQHFHGVDSGFEGSGLEKSAQEMLKRGYSYDYISDKQISGLDEENDLLETGGISYKTIIIPDAELIPLETFQKLFELADEGSTIVILNDLPRDVPGLGNLKERREKFQHIKNKLQFRDTKISGVQSAAVGEGRFLKGSNLSEILSSADVKREKMVDRGLQYIRRKVGDGYYYFVVNSSQRKIRGWIPLGKEAEAVALYNPMTGKAGYISTREASMGETEAYVQLKPGESAILELKANKMNGVAYPDFVASGEATEIEGDWTISFIKGGPELPSEIKTNSLRSWTKYNADGVKDFSGTAKYQVSFPKPEGTADTWILDLGEVKESARVVLNGKTLDTLIGPAYEITIPAKELTATNQLEVYVANSMANRVAHLDRNNIQWQKFYNINISARRSENRTEEGKFSAADWDPQESGLIGPVKLVPVELKTHRQQ